EVVALAGVVPRLVAALMTEAAELALGAGRAVERERRLLVLRRVVDPVAAPAPGRLVADRAALDTLQRDGHVTALAALAGRPVAHGSTMAIPEAERHWRYRRGLARTSPPSALPPTTHFY